MVIFHSSVNVYHAGYILGSRAMVHRDLAIACDARCILKLLVSEVKYANINMM